jgi:hypothetical protein
VKGIIFNLFEDFVIANVGDEAYEEILASADLRTAEPFVGPGSYPDEDLMALMGQVVRRMNIPADETLRAFGRFCLPPLARRFPGFMTPHTHPKAFLLTVDSFHSTEVNKLFDGARCPRFRYESPALDRLIMRYQSERRMCALAEGLLDGVATYYGVPIRHVQTACMLRGDSECAFDLTFLPPGNAA